MFENDAWKFIDKADILFFCGDNNRGESINGKAYSRQLDPLYELYTNQGYKCSHIAYPNSTLIGDKAWGNPLSSNTLHFILNKLEYLEKLLKLLNINVEWSKFIKLKYYVRIIKISSPKYVFTVGVDPVLCRVCRDNGIPITEILHGYGYDEIPWGLDQKPYMELPTHIVSFDQLSTKTFDHIKHKNVKVIPVVDYWHRKINSNINYDYLKKHLKYSNYKRVVLVTLTWGYDGEKKSLNRSGILQNGYIPIKLIELIKDSKNSSILWLIRIHPRHLRNQSRYPKLFDILTNLTNENPNVEWENSSIIPLPKLIQVVDGHVTMISEASYEAAIYGVKTMLLCPTIKENQKFKHLIDRGFASVVDYSCYSDLKKWVMKVEVSKNKFLQKNAYDVSELIGLLNDDI